jgi:hypothetical protein
MSTPAETASLYAALEQVLGREPTQTLMEQLPADGQVATKDDLKALEVATKEDLKGLEVRLREDFNSRFDGIDARFEKIDTRFERIDDRLHQIHLAMHGYVRTFVIAQVTSIFGAVGLFFGINQLI